MATDEILGKINQQQHDISQRIKEGTLDPEKVFHVFQDILKKETPNPEKVPLNLFKRNMNKEKDWKLERNIKETQLFSPNQLECVSFLEEGESFVTYEELVKRAEKIRADLGQRQAEHLLEHQEEIPKEWQQYCLVFLGTVWIEKSGSRHCSYLYFDGHWSLGFAWLSNDFYPAMRLLRPRNSQVV